MSYKTVHYEKTIKLQVGELNRAGFLRSDFEFPLQLSCQTQTVNALIRLSGPFYPNHMFFQLFRYDGEAYDITLHWRALGQNQIPRFICPPCGRKVRSLWFPDHQIGCVLCLNMSYPHYRMTPEANAAVMASRIAARLGWDSPEKLISRPRPKGMRIKYFLQRVAEYDAYQWKAQRKLRAIARELAEKARKSTV